MLGPITPVVSIVTRSNLYTLLKFCSGFGPAVTPVEIGVFDRAVVKKNFGAGCVPAQFLPVIESRKNDSIWPTFISGGEQMYNENK